MVLLFWAHLLSSPAHAAAGNFVRCDEATGECFYSPPPIVEGPVIKKLRKHYCTGKGTPLILGHDEVYTPALQNEMRIRDEYRADGAIWIGWQETWDDNTIFADMPYNYELWMKTGVFAGRMEKHMAKLLNVKCPDGKKPAEFYVAAADK